MSLPAAVVDVFAKAGAPSLYYRGVEIQRRYKISPATFWRWRQPEHEAPFPEPRFGTGPGARWALEDILKWEGIEEKVENEH